MARVVFAINELAIDFDVEDATPTSDQRDFRPRLAFNCIRQTDGL